jgi:hypothetical protein
MLKTWSTGKGSGTFSPHVARSTRPRWPKGSRRSRGGHRGRCESAVGGSAGRVLHLERPGTAQRHHSDHAHDRCHVRIDRQPGRSRWERGGGTSPSRSRRLCRSWTPCVSCPTSWPGDGRHRRATAPSSTPAAVADRWRSEVRSPHRHLHQRASGEPWAGLELGDQAYPLGVELQLGGLRFEP